MSSFYYFYHYFILFVFDLLFLSLLNSLSLSANHFSVCFLYFSSFFFLSHDLFTLFCFNTYYFDGFSNFGFPFALGRRRNEEDGERDNLVAVVPCDAIILRGKKRPKFVSCFQKLISRITRTEIKRKIKNS